MHSDCYKTQKGFLFLVEVHFTICGSQKRNNLVNVRSNICGTATSCIRLRLGTSMYFTLDVCAVHHPNVLQAEFDGNLYTFECINLY
jgi:hypothetical protein